MVVAAVDERDLDRQLGQALGRVNAGESSTDDQHAAEGRLQKYGFVAQGWKALTRVDAEWWAEVAAGEGIVLQGGMVVAGYGDGAGDDSLKGGGELVSG